MTNDMSFIGLVMQASFIVQLVMLMLLLASIASWAIILRKRKILGGAMRNSDEFEARFWSGGDLTGIYREITGSGEAPADMAGIFEAGFREYKRLTKQPGIEPARLLEGAQRSMRVATIGSTSPYVGLFGTVWGIMNSFVGLGNVQSATLAMVAPGIAEALIATAMGLFAAIPAVVAYNRYADQVNRLELRYDTFAEELSTILQRYAHSRSGSGAEA